MRIKPIATVTELKAFGVPRSPHNVIEETNVM